MRDPKKWHKDVHILIFGRNVVNDWPLLHPFSVIIVVMQGIYLCFDPLDSPCPIGVLPERPLQLIRPDPHHHRKLEIISSNVKHLHHIHTAVAVVAVVGKFHSGKSFLLNQLMGKREGFGVGPSVRPETMGIWMWGKVYIARDVPVFKSDFYGAVAVYGLATEVIAA